MRTLISLPVILLTLLLAVFGITYAVSAVGAPSENYTTPDPPLSDNITPEIKPANYILKDVTAQTQSARPSINFDFASQLTQDKYTVMGNETWDLYIDINIPGWVYIYEYLPPSSDISGRWIAYKWEVPQNGIWKLGPFTPEQNEPEGVHTYQVWYYADGEWAADVPDEPYKTLNWSYVKDSLVQTEPEGPTPVASIAPETPATSGGQEPESEDDFYKFITNPIVLLAGPSIIVIIVIFIRYLAEKSRSKKTARGTAPSEKAGEAGVEEPTPSVKEEQPSVAAITEPASETMTARAVLVLPNSMEITLNSNSVIIGRKDLARGMELDTAGLISRKHFEIVCKDNDFFIEDSGSSNGTSLNGKSIKDQGQIKLNDDDLIEPGDAIKLRFLIL